MSKPRWLDKWALEKFSDGWWLTGLDKYRKTYVCVKVQWQGGWHSRFRNKAYYVYYDVNDYRYRLGKSGLGFVV